MNTGTSKVLKDDRDSGGTLVIISYYDENGKSCSEDKAVRGIIDEISKDGETLVTTYCKKKIVPNSPL